MPSELTTKIIKEVQKRLATFDPSLSIRELQLRGSELHEYQTIVEYVDQLEDEFEIIVPRNWLLMRTIEDWANEITQMALRGK